MKTKHRVYLSHCAVPADTKKVSYSIQSPQAEATGPGDQNDNSEALSAPHNITSSTMTL